MMKIKTYYLINGEWIELHPATQWPDNGGYESPQAAIKELSRRFAHRNPRVENGVLVMNSDEGGVQHISFEEGVA